MLEVETSELTSTCQRESRSNVLNTTFFQLLLIKNLVLAQSAEF